jgi:amidase
MACCEVMEAYLTQIDRMNPIVNAIIILADRDKLMAQARQRDDCLRRGEYLGWMHGFPIATNCRGDADIGATPVLRPREGFLSAVENRISARLLCSGGIVIGTANSAECGTSGNADIGIARNAYDQTKTAGGSGAALALALRMVPIAEASDDAGSLRIPAAFNNVFGFRPSVGRRADDAADLYDPILRAVGPMARTVADIARVFSVQQGYDRLTSIFMGEDWSGWANPLRRGFRGIRVAWLGDLDGYLAVETNVMDICERALAVLESLGCRIDRVCPNYPFECLSHAWLKLHRSQIGDPLMHILEIERVPAHDVYNRGLPMGLQIMSRHGDDLACLRFASAYEGTTDWIDKRRPRLLGGIESECGSH